MAPVSPSDSNGGGAANSSTSPISFSSVWADKLGSGESPQGWVGDTNGDTNVPKTSKADASGDTSDTTCKSAATVTEGEAASSERPISGSGGPCWVASNVNNASADASNACNGADPSWTVMKFGGTSLGNLECLKRLIGIIAKHREECSNGRFAVFQARGSEFVTKKTSDGDLGSKTADGDLGSKSAAADASAASAGISGPAAGSSESEAGTEIPDGTSNTNITNNNINNHIILVCSAMGKTTNLLIETLDACMNTGEVNMSRLVEFHRKMFEEIVTEKWTSEVDDLEKLEDWLKDGAPVNNAIINNDSGTAGSGLSGSGKKNFSQSQATTSTTQNGAIGDGNTQKNATPSTMSRNSSFNNNRVSNNSNSSNLSRNSSFCDNLEASPPRNRNGLTKQENLFLEENRFWRSTIEPLLLELQNVLQGVCLLRQTCTLSDGLFDLVCSFGERLSVRLVAFAIRQLSGKDLLNTGSLNSPAESTSSGKADSTSSPINELTSVGPQTPSPGAGRGRGSRNGTQRSGQRSPSRLSTRGQLDAVFLDSWDIGLETSSGTGNTHSSHSDAKVSEDSMNRVGEFFREQFLSTSSERDRVAVVTGYIAKDSQGKITTLGRDGSDLSATILGAAVRAKVVQIYKDVDGVMTADPRIVKKAKKVKFLSYEEAAELAYFGAKCVHPRCILPIWDLGIPMQVTNQLKPSESGTTITMPDTFPETKYKIRALSTKQNVTLIDAVTTRMLGQAGFLSELFQEYARHEVSVDTIATSDVSVSVTVEAGVDPVRIENLASSLNQKRIADVTVQKGFAMLTVIIPPNVSSADVLSICLEYFKTEKIEVRLVSHGASRINANFLLNSEDLLRSVVDLHELFFYTEATRRVV